MSEEPIQCRFVFTSAEYMRSMRCHWLTPTARWTLVAIVLVFLGATIGLSFLADAQHHLGFTEIIRNMFPFAVFFGVFLLMKWCFFVSGPAFNKEMIFYISGGSIRLKNVVSDTEAKWEIFARVTEDNRGFALYFRPKAFHWLPKNGFVDDACIKGCRDLLRQKIKDSKRLFPT